MEDCETNDCRKEKRGCKGCYYENKNIDKDIEILKEHIKELDEEKVLYGGFLSRKQAISNVLTQLNTNKYDINNYEERIISLKSELETYKKIAEKLAEWARLSWCRYGCCEPTKLCKHCPKASEEKGVKCIIDWARKEVEK